VGIFSTQNLCALLQNSAVHRQRRQQNPLEMFIERAAPNNELESFFSQIAIHGYKPRLMELQVCITIPRVGDYSDAHARPNAQPKL
jgi:hypothetical protein